MEAALNGPFSNLDTQLGYITIIVVALLIHTFSKNRDNGFGLMGPTLFLLSIGVFGWLQAYRMGGTDSRAAFLMFIMILAFFYVLIGECMYLGLGMLLTKVRGEKWIKELDFVYLLLGTQWVFSRRSIGWTALRTASKGAIGSDPS
jgi:hypothetical protein